MGPSALRALGKAKSILCDVKAALPADQVDGRLKEPPVDRDGSRRRVAGEMG